MSKKIKKLLIALCTVLGMSSLVACNVEKAYNKPIPETNLAETYMGEIEDEKGNLLVPFDVAYAEAFETGAFQYNDSQILLKMSKSYDGKRTNDLRKCGIERLDFSIKTDNGNWWIAKLNGEFDAVTAVKKARSLEEVIVADFDYIYETETVEAEGDTTGILSDVCGNQKVGNQHYLKQCSIQESWRFLQKQGISAGGLSSVTVAVIDTGVDYTHPDLKANMWVNMGEIPANGIDDDKNGYIDDIHGVDTIADNGGADGNEGDPMDDHGHGTHVAGIIGASNNKEGVVGIAYNAKIMAVKAGQASGVFNQSDIAEAILYAYEMGADVINMSFGGTACSIAVQDALTTAYTTASLVAAAGNDGVPNEPFDPLPPLPNYPAALSYVIGVMSVDERGVESSFTNFDPYVYNAIEYEVYAPGEEIMSTLPNSRYGKLSGTSMAAPVVSGAAALLRSYFTDRDMYPSKFIMAQLCATSEEKAICNCLHPSLHNLPMILDIYKAFTKMPKPDVNLYDWYLFDTESIADGNTGDGVVDAGETIEIGAILRNRWGMSKNTVVTISDDSNLGVDNPYVEILTASQKFEGVGTYSTKDTLLRDGSIVTGTELPLVIKIADNCPNDYLISLSVTITAENALDETDKTVYKTFGTIEFWVRNGVILPSQITEDMTLTKDKYYIIPNSTYIAEGVTVTVEPGTQIQFWTDDPNDPNKDAYIAMLNVAGEFITRGTEEEPIKMFPSEMRSEYAVDIHQEDNGYIELNYTKLTNPLIDIDFADHCEFNANYEGDLYYSYFENGSTRNYGNCNGMVCVKQTFNSSFYKLDGYGVSGVFDGCIFYDSSIMYGTTTMHHHNTGSGGLNYRAISLSNCVFMGNYFTQIDGYKSNSLVSSYTKEILGMYQLTLEKIVPNIETKKTYLQLRISMGGDHPHILQYSSLAKLLNGEICCIETKEEYQFINDNSLSGHVGLLNQAKTWYNGNLVTTEVNELLCNGNGYYCQNTCTYIGNQGAYSLLLFEIDNCEEFTSEDFQTSYDKWIELGLNSFMTGNAIINDLSNVELGFRINAPEGLNSSSIQTIGLSSNYWGSYDKTIAERQVIDFDDFSTLVDINLGEILTTAPENTFPFVTDAFILDSNGERVQTVGNEKITVVVQFNRDMNTEIPLRVRFGSFYPYADYEVSGEYVSDREWRGEYTLKTTIENGNLFFNIENGEAADDSWLKLYEHAGRFTFELDTTAAQAMLMQGEATETGIQLTWMQDDFDTLLGYNVYRSDKEDGLYVRLNDYVLSQEETSFFDDTVEPGKVYYYNFTVVKTDLTESIPSGKIVIMSMDTMAPNIYHSPVRTAYTGNNLLISATITDNLMIKNAKLYYRAVGTTEWKSVTMNPLNSKYTAIIGAENLSLEGLEYYIQAFDGISYTYKGSVENPYQVTVKLAVDANSLGDVDGDGVITVKDAQMLLMAINDLYNLTEEEFMRADVDGNGVLQAFEALRILDYISGKVTTIMI